MDSALFWRGPATSRRRQWRIKSSRGPGQVKGRGLQIAAQLRKHTEINTDIIAMSSFEATKNKKSYRNNLVYCNSLQIGVFQILAQRKRTVSIILSWSENFLFFTSQKYNNHKPPPMQEMIGTL